jgi:hypothetical protein
MAGRDLSSSNSVGACRKNRIAVGTNAAAPAGDENGLARKVEFLIHAFLVAYFDVVIAIDFTQRNPR